MSTLHEATPHPQVAHLSPEEKRALLAQALKQKARQSQQFPLSFAQQRLWFIDRLEGSSPFYNIPVALRLRGRVDVPCLRRCLDEVVRRHESLRTTFASKDGRPVQVVRPACPLPLATLDLSRHPAEERLAVARRLATEENQKPFDLSQDLPLRATLLRLHDGDSVLVLIMHHIVSDGWSMGVLIRELVTLYGAFSEGRPSPLPELPIQYADFAHWQRERLSGEVLGAQLDYWRQKLEGLAPLQLPLDRARPAVQTFRGSRETLALGREVYERLEALGRGEGVTLFMTLLAAFKVLLMRHTGQEDVAVGTPIANRNRREVESLIGFFVNALVLRTDLSGDPTFRELLGRVRETTLGAYAHQDLPFEKLVEELHPERDLSVNPLFQIMFALQNVPMPAVDLPGLQVSSLQVDDQTALFDLTLSLWEGAEGITGSLDYNRELFEAATVKRMVGHYVRLLQAVAADPDARLSSLDLLDEEERGRLLVRWNETASDYGRGRSLQEVFEEQVSRGGERDAVVYGGERLTYAELNRRSNRLAHYLRRLGVRPDQPVGLLVARSVELVVGALGILKAGGAYLPLDPSYPRERLEFMVADAGVGVLLAGEGLEDMLEGRGARVVSLAGDAAEIARESEENPPRTATGENLAYVIYTSGSTGTPKGISIPQRAVNRLVLNTDYVQLTAEDRVGQASNTSFDAATFELWGALLNGGVLVGVTKDVALSPQAFARQLKDEGVSALFLTTALFNQMAREEPAAFNTLRHVLFGGEAVDPRWVEEVLGAGGPERLLHVYGPTETTTFATWHLVGDVTAGAVTIPIGKPIANTRAYVLDGRWQPVPVGVVGELYLGGDGLARDYWRRPALTAERFVPDPFSEEPGGRLYRTGDLVRYREGGEIEFVGRVDNQVKIRGFRIEPGEIEAALLEHEAAREAVVLAREDGPGERRLVAYVVPEAGQSPTVGELRDYLKRRLPSYMVPAVLMLLEELPLTPNGKVDRRRLPAPERLRPESAEGYVGPQTPVQEVLANIWAELLGLERVGIRDDFFELGGHSLLATQMASRISEALRVEVPLREVFGSPTVEGLARVVESAREAETLRVKYPLVRVSREERLPLSFPQQRMWLLNQLVPESPAYNITSAVRLKGRLDADALARAVTAIVARHESLRTTFAAEGKEPVQVVGPAREVALAPEDLSGLAEGPREERVRELTRETSLAPFDLARGPVVRFRLLRLSGDEHVLVVVMHHIVSDGWSLGVFVRELRAVYEAHLNGGEAALPELAVQYADFAHWQREYLSGEVLEAQLDYWKGRLSDAPAVIELPTDRPRPTVQTSRGRNRAVRIPRALSESLRELSRGEGVTLFMTLLAAWKSLLSKYSGQTDILVGTPVANRTRPELETLIGFFVNTLVLRTDLSGDPTFRELLGRERETTLGAYEHQDMPFERLVEELQPERDLSRHPLFQVMFALQNTPQPSLELPGLSLSLMPVENDTALFDLTLSLWDTEEGLSGFLGYNTDLYDDETADRMMERFELLLRGVAARPDGRLSELSLLTEEESARLLVEWNATGADFPLDRCVHELVGERAAETPDAVAVIADGTRVTYRELDEQSNQLANYLRESGVGPETLVAVFMVRSAEMVIGLLGILKAGGAYLPLEPAFPKERLAFMLADSQAPVLLTEQRLLQLLPESDCKVVCLDADWVEIAARSDERPDAGATADNLAYVIYTSGSTGQPKAIQLHHRGLANLVHWHARSYGVTPDDRATLLAGLSFDASVWELWPYLASGASLSIPDEDTRATPSKLLPWFAAEGVTLAFLPTPLAEAVMGEPAPAGLALRAVLTGGDKLHRGTPEGVPYQLINHYGPAENTVVTTAAVAPCGEAGRGAPPIGRPVANTRVYVLDAGLRPVPVDVPGEIYIAGVGLARGYLNRPELTAERFVPDPFSAEPGARLYRTGDRARWLPGGQLEFLGRLDNQVKVRGFRIELGEVEAVLLGHESVREAVVVAREERAGDCRLAAYVVSEPAGATTAGELRAYMREKVPAFMVPTSFVMLESLPLTPNGKVDRRRLPAPEKGSDSDTPYVAPRTPTEEVLANIWAELLEVERVGVHDNFFELGGHSLLATQVVSRVREVFRLELPLHKLFESPTVAELSAVVETLRQADQKLLAPAIAPVGRERELPLSFAQQRLWFIDQFEAKSPAYNMPFALRHTGSLDVAALERSLAEVIGRHEALRTTFTTKDGEPLQVVNEGVSFRLAVEDVSHVAEAARMDEVQRRGREYLMRPFDLGADLMLRAALYRLGEEEHVLLLVIHHIASDGWSMGILAREMTELYGALSAGREPSLPQLPVQYADYAYWQREWLRGEALDTQVAYWKQRLAGAPPLLELPTDRPRPAVQTFRGAKHPVLIPKALGDKLRAFSQREGVTLFMTLLAGFQTLFHRYTGQEDILVGTPIAGRTRVETEGLIGFFVNTLVMRSRLSGETTVKELLAQVREDALGAYAHQDLPFEKLVEELHPERNLSHAPIFQVMFAVQNAPMPSAELAGMSLAPVQIESGRSLFDLTLSLMEGPGELNGSFEYNTDLFDAATVERMTGHYLTVLDSMVADTARRLSALELLPHAERRRVLYELNDTARPYPSDKCVHQVFEARAAETPEADAVVYGGERLSYAELNRRSNRLAHYLRRLGVRPDQPVGLLMERSFDMVIAVLGILKAGGAYLPLDPSYPRERLEFMVADAGVGVLLAGEGLEDMLEGRGARVVSLAGDGAEIARESEENPACTATAEHLAYVTYTSGSTGTPKGVEVPHRGVLRLVRGADYVTLDHSTVTLHLSTISFDASTFELWAPLLNGGRCVLWPGGVPSAADLRGAVSAQGVNTMWLTSSLFNAVVGEDAAALRGLNQLLVGGEALSPAHVGEALASLDGTTLVNGYGPTEGTTFTCCHRIGGEDAEGAGIPVGKPIANTQVYVLDAGMGPVPVGVAGELYAGGDGLARGYLSRPGLTAERFVPHPFSEEAGARLYRTGDVVRWTARGVIEFLGRADEQVKIRGFRIEPGEVEAALLGHEGVREAVVAVREERAGEKRLVAYFVAEDEPAPSAADLRAYLQERLPEYMIPSAFVSLDIIPLTPNGKVDKRALPSPDQSIRAAATHALVAPRDEVERQLTLIWEDLLGFGPVGVRDNFFELGGHSLLAVRLMARIEQQFGRKLPLASLFQNPTVEHLARALDGEEGAGAASPLVALQTGGERPPLFVVHPASGTVFSYAALARQLGSEQPVYGFQSPGLDGEGGALGSVEEMATAYVEAMRRVQPAGPYYLAGWSMGGFVAYEMARLLRALGEEVALLALFDSHVPPKKQKPVKLDDVSLLVNFAHDLGLPLEQIEGWLKPSGDSGAEEGLNSVLERARADGLVPEGFEVEQLRRLLDTFKGNVEAMQGYAPPEYDGRLVLFKAEEQIVPPAPQGRVTRWLRRAALLGSRVRFQKSGDEPTLGWGRLAAGGVSVRDVPGNHYSMFREPNLEVLARELRESLDEARARRQQKAGGEGRAA